jgi:arginyl-tRNA synthetase
MLAMHGNSAPYLQYAYVRINSILERAGTTPAALDQAPPEIHLAAPAELALAGVLLRLADVLNEEARTFRPNALTSYLFDVATAFSGFFENCPVVQSEEPVRSSRLALCRLTARTMETGLGLLGIETLPRM